MKYYMQYLSPIGSIVIGQEGDFITMVSFGTEGEGILKETPLIQSTYKQLMQYMNGERKQFDISIHLKGTSFQKRVWECLQSIPYGATKTYQELAIMVGNPKACRAVGGANHLNPIAIIVPCHRVIGKNGSLTGYGGGLSIKKYLLNLEKSKFIR